MKILSSVNYLPNSIQNVTFQLKYFNFTTLCSHALNSCVVLWSPVVLQCCLYHRSSLINFYCSRTFCYTFVSAFANFALCTLLSLSCTSGLIFLKWECAVIINNSQRNETKLHCILDFKCSRNQRQGFEFLLGKCNL